MLKIKLARFGKRNQPHYRVVVNEARDKRDGSYVESLGHYAPAQQPKVLVIDKDRYEYWLGQGAQPTDTVAALYKKSQAKDPFPAKKKKPSKKELAKQEEAKKAAAEAAEAKAEPEASVEVVEEEKTADAEAAEKPAGNSEETEPKE